MKGGAPCALNGRQGDRAGEASGGDISAKMKWHEVWLMRPGWGQVTERAMRARQSHSAKGCRVP